MVGVSPQLVRLPRCAGTSVGNGASQARRHTHPNVVRTPADQPGRANTHDGGSISSRSAAKYSASTNSSYALARERVTGAGANSVPHRGPETTAPASHRHDIATPPAYQSVTPTAACSAHRASAARHTTANSRNGTRRFRNGTAAITFSVTSMSRRVKPIADTVDR